MGAAAFDLLGNYHLVAELVEQLHRLDADRRIVVIRELVAEEMDAAKGELGWNRSSGQVFRICARRKPARSAGSTFVTMLRVPLGHRRGVQLRQAAPQRKTGEAFDPARYVG